MLGNNLRNDDTQFYFVGGGLGSLTGAAYLLRDCGFDGKNIHIIESLPTTGGSNDAAGTPEKGWVMRGERMFNRQTYENFWDIMGSVPSIKHEGNSVTEDMFSFSDENPTYAKARFLDEDGEIMDASSYGLNKQEMLQIVNLVKADESDLDGLTISDWFGDSEHFFHSIFWYSYEATFAFQPWSSVMEFRRYIKRFFHLILRLTTMHGLTLTENNQYESVIKPLMKVLEGAGVQFVYNTSVTDMDFADNEQIEVVGLHTESDGKKGYIALHPQDKVVATIGTMTDNTTYGTSTEAATMDTSYPMSATLWKNIAQKKAGLGDPDVFFTHPDKSAWMSFNCTFKGHTFENWLEKYTHNKTGLGFSSTFVESPWHMELRSPLPPFFVNQDKDHSFIWMVAFYSSEKGKYTNKSEYDCNGMEILEEILQSLPMDEATRAQCRNEVVAAIPVIMPYIDSQFLPRSVGDRPLVVPENSKNLGLIGQYVEISEDCVFTEEYSVRGARTAVYKLLGSKKEVAPVKPMMYDVRILAGAIISYLK